MLDLLQLGGVCRTRTGMARVNSRVLVQAKVAKSIIEINAGHAQRLRPPCRRMLPNPIKKNLTFIINLDYIHNGFEAKRGESLYRLRPSASRLAVSRALKFHPLSKLLLQTNHELFVTKMRARICHVNHEYP
jgi:formaldehyde-activating enzyme involved in methanogenesis